jgi:tRNA G18 (ribose-2'-O)-methylase SpoU
MAADVACEDRRVPVIRITDPEDARLDDYARLTDVVLRSRHEPAKGLYIAESAEVIRRAVEAGHAVRSMLMAERWVEGLGGVLEAAGAGPAGDVPVYVAEPDVLQAITGFNMHRGALAAMHRPVLESVADLLARACGGPGPHRIVVLEDIVDHTNVGAIFRSAAALGAEAVLVAPRCADPLYRRSVRVSMGTVFQVPWTRMTDWDAGLADLRAHGFTVAALALADASMSLDDLAASPPARLALVLGAEGDGLSRAALESADLVVRIPMAGAVDSLNVAAASAVALWALR